MDYHVIILASEDEAELNNSADLMIDSGFHEISRDIRLAMFDYNKDIDRELEQPIAETLRHMSGDLNSNIEWVELKFGESGASVGNHSRKWIQRKRKEVDSGDLRMLRAYFASNKYKDWTRTARELQMNPMTVKRRLQYLFTSILESNEWEDLPKSAYRDEVMGKVVALLNQD